MKLHELVKNIWSENHGKKRQMLAQARRTTNERALGVGRNHDRPGGAPNASDIAFTWVHAPRAGTAAASPRANFTQGSFSAVSKPIFASKISKY